MTTVRDLQTVAEKDAPITMLTAYDAVTVAEVASRTGPVARGVSDVVVVADMPFLS
jgi:ketopantoate hydroxymethyltransferase